MDFGAIISILFMSLMAMVPIVLTSVGAAWSERAGVVSIGYEGVLLMSAFFGAIFAELAHNAVVGLLGGVLVGILLGMLHGAITVYLKGDHTRYRHQPPRPRCRALRNTRLLGNGGPAPAPPGRTDVAPEH